MKIHLATDHAGFAHKEALKEYLLAQGIECVDHGAMSLDPEDDFPDYILPAAQAVAMDVENAGIIFGGSGEGEAMAANKVPGIRCTAYYGGPEEIVTLSREHNNANMLSIGARFVSIEDVLKIVSLWLATPFSGDERHIRRLQKFS